MLALFSWIPPRLRNFKLGVVWYSWLSTRSFPITSVHTPLDERAIANPRAYDLSWQPVSKTTSSLACLKGWLPWPGRVFIVRGTMESKLGIVGVHQLPRHCTPLLFKKRSVSG